jgi:hypothetical protein
VKPKGKSSVSDETEIAAKEISKSEDICVRERERAKKKGT